MKHESFEQGSSEWHEFRKTRIGASDAPIICGLSPWSSSLQLWMEKLGKVAAKDLSENFAVQRGVRLEPVVRGMASIKLDCDFEPAVFTDDERPYMMASLDLWNEEKQWMGEIKVGNKADHARLKEDDPSTVPEKYYAQLQQQMYVVKPKRAFYCSYWIEKGKDENKGDLKIVEVFPDQKFIEAYLPILDAFNECVIKDIPPEAVQIKP